MAVWLVAGERAPLLWLAASLALAGFCLWVRPPRTSAGLLFEAALLLLGVWTATAFFPVPGSWRGRWWEEAFRLGLDHPLVHQAGRTPAEELTTLGFDWALPAPATLQSWATLEALVPWALVVAVFYGVGTLVMAPEPRRVAADALRWLALPAALAAVVWSLMGGGNGGVGGFGIGDGGWVWAALAVVWWGPGRVPGRVPGRPAQVALAAALGLVAAAGWLGGLAPVGAVAGAWLAEVAGRRRAGPGLVFWGWRWGGMIAGAALLAFVPGGGGRGPARGGVWADTVRMVADQPVIGVGPGNFAALFPQYREHSAGTDSVTTARSDLLQFAAERGLPGAAAAIALAAAAFWRLRRLEQAEDRAVREPLAGGFLMLLTAGLWESAWHVPGTALLGALLLALARPIRRQTWALHLQPVAWCGFGGVLMAAGLIYGATALLRLPLHGSVTQPERPRSWAAADNPPWPLEQWQRQMAAISQRPLSAREYFERARMRLVHGKFPRLIPVDLARARFLAPDQPELPLWEGVAWWPVRQDEAWAAWSRAWYHPQADKARVGQVVWETAPRTPDNEERWRRITGLGPGGGGEAAP